MKISYFHEIMEDIISRYSKNISKKRDSLKENHFRKFLMKLQVVVIIIKLDFKITIKEMITKSPKHPK